MTLSPDGRSTRPQMAVRLTDIPALLVERVEAAHPAPAFFLLAEGQVLHAMRISIAMKSRDMG